jgi:hypothetical protein
LDLLPPSFAIASFANKNLFPRQEASYQRVSCREGQNVCWFCEFFFKFLELYKKKLH